ncbi:MAG: hydroxymethylglutaryl-CoA reductase, degradative [Thermoproteota archaeon]|nr:MAG: hydroxymethylglutaryl-CoA reductase, degradative [Candidatus Korarchaeota archaeon]
MKGSSRIPGFYKLSVEERLEKVAELAELTEEEKKLLLSGGLPLDVADRMIENVIGVMAFPLGIAVNFLVNGRDYLIPMCIEEPSVVAAASHAAKLARPTGGFKAWSTPPVMIGQIQLAKVKDPYAARLRVLEAKQEILEKANEQDPTLVKLGGGAVDLRAKPLLTPAGPMLIVELLVNVVDAMGANAVNTMAEAVAPLVEKAAGSGRVYLRIISNLATERMAFASAEWSKDVIGGEDVVEGIVLAWAFAAADPYRAATHNKGIMNGISAVIRATGNDTRAAEAGAHAYAALGEHYKPLTTYEVNERGNLVGTIELPIAAGIVGGATRIHPLARVALKILGVKSARELSEVLAAVGLAQNFAALRALATEGIQRGHMELHARSLAMMAGAKGELVDKIAEIMVREKNIKFHRARELLEQLRSKHAGS